MLFERFKKTLKHVENFDVLVGYFRTSGFHLLYKQFEKINKIRILNGIDVDKKTFDAYQQAQSNIDFESITSLRERLANDFQDEVVNSEDNQETDEAYLKFIEFLKNGKM